MTEPNLQPTLVGATITVRPITTDDWQALYAIAADPELWAQHPSRDRYRENVFRAYFDGALNSNSAFVFVDNGSNQLIGSSRYHGHDPKLSEIEIGWTFVARSRWGGSVNSEVKTLMLEHAFTFVDTVVFWVGETNQRSRKAMEKIGGQLRAGLHHRALAGDAAHVIYEIRRADWQRR